MREINLTKFQFENLEKSRRLDENSDEIIEKIKIKVPPERILYSACIDKEYNLCFMTQDKVVKTEWKSGGGSFLG